MPRTEIYFILSLLLLRHRANCLFASFKLCTVHVRTRMRQEIKQQKKIVLVATASFTLLGNPLIPSFRRFSFEMARLK